MELTFIRSTIELKFTELQMLFQLYNDGIVKELDRFSPIATPEDQQEVESVTTDLAAIKTELSELGQEFDITVARASVLYADLYKKIKDVVEQRRQSATSTHDGLSITRQPLLYSTFADAAGYDEASKTMDIAYARTGVYRYYDVPKEVYEKLKSRNSMKGFRAELAAYRVEKLS